MEAQLNQLQAKLDSGAYTVAAEPADGGKAVKTAAAAGKTSTAARAAEAAAAPQAPAQC